VNQALTRESWAHARSMRLMFYLTDSSESDYLPSVCLSLNV